MTVWDRDKSHQDDLMGKTVIDLANLERETTHRLWRELEDGSGDIFLLLTISGTTASETISDLAAHEETPVERAQLVQRYSIANTLQRVRDVGHLTVKVIKLTSQSVENRSRRTSVSGVCVCVNFLSEGSSDRSYVTCVMDMYIFTFFKSWLVSFFSYRCIARRVSRLPTSAAKAIPSACSSS